jgi:hypothetical protein
MSSDQTALPSSKVELIATLRAIADRRPQTREDLKQLERECVSLALHIQRKMTISDVPHEIWHFLHDPDIRFKDPAYAEAQLAVVRDALAHWESGDDI